MVRRIWLILMLALCLTGCARAGREPGGADTTAPGAEPEREEQGQKKQDETEDGVLEEESRETGTEAGTIREEKRSLSGEELQWFEESFNSLENNGFLLSGYESPEYMNLAEVFYNGAGLEFERPSEEELKAYLKANGQEEVVTDTVRLTTGQIDEFLMKKAGIELKDSADGLSWTYLPEYDCYISEHGDTNYMKFICDGGEVDGDRYTIRCREDTDGEVRYACTVTLKKEGDDFLFSANRIDSGGYRYWGENETGGKETSNVDAAVLRELTAQFKRRSGKEGEDFQAPIFDSDVKYYTEEELGAMAPQLRAVFRNEIYARHGYLFQDAGWAAFFEPYSWYEGKYPAKEFDTGWFNDYEAENLKTVTRLEG